jgi:methylmalonyl-CoA/ethylmalonyl-CoA epimerase
MKSLKERTIIQVAHVVHDLYKTLDTYWNKMGIGPWDIYELKPPLLRESMYRGKPSDHTYLVGCLWIGDRHYEVIQPLTGYSIYDEFLEKKGEGFHHVKEWVDDCAKAVEEFKENGIEVIQSGKIDEDEFYYLDTEPILGIVYELGNNGKIRPPEKRYPEL